MRFHFVARLLFWVGPVLCVLPGGVAVSADSASIKALWHGPPRQYSTGPLWVWNDLLSEEQIRSTLRDLAGQKVKQAFVHPRPGLMTPYLSDDWFRLWRAALDEARRLDMNIWIYDENSYPSGFAGGLVPEAMPESRGGDLVFREVKRRGAAGADVFAMFLITDDGYRRVREAAGQAEAPPEGRYLVAAWRDAPTSPWFGDKFYVDLLKPGVTEKFLEITLEAYRRQIGEHFGRRVPGVFTDEPHLCPAGGVHFNAHVAEEFQKRWGYDLADHLPALVRPLGDWKRIRHNYYQVLLEQFIEHWAQPCWEYCERHNLEFTGHYWEHGWPRASHGPDNMAMYAWHQRPAIDTLMNQYGQDVHGQFGNSRAVRELASVANQLGRRRTLCEAYGAGGWDLRFEDMKRIGDWLFVLGVNTLNEHLSFITIRGARKRDHPQSFSYHEPWWDAYHVMAQYFTRLSLAMSQGQQVHRILVLEPTTSAWLYQPDPGHREKLETLGQTFQDLVNRLEAAQVEYDLGCEDIIARHGAVKDGKFVVGRRAYHTVVLPPMCENLNEVTAQLLRRFAGRGGRVLSCGPPPALVDGQPSDTIAALASAPEWHEVDSAELPQRLLELATDGFAIHRQEGDEGILFHHRRELDDGQLLLLVNTSIESPSAGTVHSSLAGVEQWCPASGAVKPYRFTRTDEGIVIPFRLPPCGSLLLFLSQTGKEPPAVREETWTVVEPTGSLAIERLGPNVLTLDYVDLTVGEQRRQNLYFYQANRLAFVHNGLERNPWDSAVQFRDHWLRWRFPAESGFQATWRFTVEDPLPGPLWIVIERPDLYQVRCNGQPVAAARGAWWLDRSFGKLEITPAVRVGENEVTVRARPMTIFHELESAYLLGDFAVEPTDAGFAIRSPRPLRLGAWNEQGHPFYAAGVRYRQKFQVSDAAGRWVVRLGQWHGSVARVKVNGELAGHIAWQPWECEVTDLVQPGENEVAVEVIGTLKNTLGPHHGSPQLGRAWPRAFQQAPETGPPPGDQYHTVGYGLFEPFVLVRRM